jgi:hypothetical protein
VGQVVRPDGHGIWTERGSRLPFLVEYDNGTERLDRLAGKLDGYARLAEAAGHPNWVQTRAHRYRQCNWFLGISG